MQVSVKFVGQIKTLAGTDQTAVELPAGATVARLFGALGESMPALIGQKPLIMVNHQIPHKVLL